MSTQSRLNSSTDILNKPFRKSNYVTPGRKLKTNTSPYPLALTYKSDYTGNVVN